VKELLRIAWPALLLAVLLCLPWLANPMFLDDWHNLLQAREASWSPSGLAGGFSFLGQEQLATWNLPTGLHYHFFRPLLVASFKLDLELWGTASFGFHITNLLIQLGCILLVTGVMMRLSGDRRLARLGAVLWVVNPQTAVALIWTSGRTELFVTLWVLASFWCYVVAREEERPVWLLPSLAFLVLAFLSKESAAVLPLALAAYEVTFGRARAPDRKAWLGTALRHLAPFALLTLAYLVFRFALFDAGPLPGRPYINTPTEPSFIGFAIAKITYYLFAVVTGAFILPLFVVDFLRSHLLALFGFVVLTTAIYYVIAKRTGRGPFHRFLWLLLAAAFVPTLPTVATDLYLYFAAIPVAMLLASAFLSSRRVAEADAGSTAGPAAARTRGWRRYALVGYVAFLAIGHLGRGVFYREHGLASERTYDEIVADASGRLPEGSRLYLVNMPFVSAHVTPMLRLRAGLEDVRAIMLTVSTAWVDHSARARIECVSPTHLRIRPPTGRDAFFTTKEEWYLQQFELPIDPHRDYRTVDATVHPVTEGERIVALDLILDGPSTGDLHRVYSFYEDGEHFAHRVCGPSSGSLPAPGAQETGNP